MFKSQFVLEEAAITLEWISQREVLIPEQGCLLVSFDPSEAGEGNFTITYQFTDGNGCSNTASDVIFVESCLSIAEGSNELFSIYPNPADQYRNDQPY
jgi:hypothetical protein